MSCSPRSGVLLLLAFAASVPSILQLQRTGRLTPWDYRVDHTTDDWLVRYSVLWKFMLMATPVGFLVLLSLAARRSPSRRVGAAILLLASCWAGVLLQPYVPYLYYYGRYVVADLLPLALILCAVVIAGALRRGRRALGITVVALIVACSAPFALLQVGHLEGERVGIAAELARRVGPQDVVVFAGPDDRVTLPLKVAYDRQLAVIPQSELGTEPSGFLLEDLYDLVASVGGRTFLALRHPSTGPGARLEIQGDFTMGWFSNTEHWRDQTFQSSSRDGLLLPSTARDGRALVRVRDRAGVVRAGGLRRHHRHGRSRRQLPDARRVRARRDRRPVDLGTSGGGMRAGRRPPSERGAADGRGVQPELGGESPVGVHRRDRRGRGGARSGDDEHGRAGSGARRTRGAHGDHAHRARSAGRGALRRRAVERGAHG